MPNPVYIYDAVRTPRSKGKSTGTLHEVKPIDLAAGLLVELQKRHDLDTSYVDDVVMGCVSPVGEQGSDVAKMVVQNADWDESVPGVQLDRFCASGLEAVNIAAQKVASCCKSRCNVAAHLHIEHVHISVGRSVGRVWSHRKSNCRASHP